MDELLGFVSVSLGVSPGLSEGVIHFLLPYARVLLCEIQSANIY